MTQAIILAGGLGTRLRELHPDLPKILAPVAGKPFLHWQLSALQEQGVSSVHFALGYRADDIQHWVTRNHPDALTATFSVEPAPLGTAGALKFAEPHITTDPFLVLNGDSLLPALDIPALLAAHRAAHATATIAVTTVPDATRFGTLALDPHNNVTRFHEKSARSSGPVNGGVYAMARSILATIPPNTPVSMETDIFPSLAAHTKLHAHPTPPPPLDMGTPQGLKAMEQYLRHPKTK